MTIMKKTTSFEEEYIQLRAHENRILNVDEIIKLPNYKKKAKHSREWELRQDSFRKFNNYFKSLHAHSILDLGCGNGWLLNKLYNPESVFYGVDINQLELDQASEIHKHRKNVYFINDDIHQIKFKQEFDLIIINAAIQYFHPLQKLINHLLSILSLTGEIHIIDSPFYKNKLDAKNAKLRSIQYFRQNDALGMAEYYHHHTYSDLAQYNLQILYQPKSWLNKLSRSFGKRKSPFPWIKIAK